MAEFANIGHFTTDPEIEMEGVELSLGHGLFITVRRSGGSNKAYNAYVAKVFDEKKELTQSDQFTDEDAAELMYDIFARKVVIDWRGFKDAKGKEIPFTVENCIDLFRKSPDEIYRAVYDNANNNDNFRYKKVFEAGNVSADTLPGK